MTINRDKISAKGYADVEYRMSPELAKQLLKGRKPNSSVNQQEYLCRYVNEQLGVKGNCVVVTTTL